MEAALPRKTYVDVSARFTPDGRLIPLWITWEDGRRYFIDRVLRTERAASRKGGGIGIRYTCMVCGNRIHLFYEENYRWFVERRARMQEDGV